MKRSIVMSSIGGYIKNTFILLAAVARAEREELTALQLVKH